MFQVRNAYATEDISVGDHLEYPSQFSPMVDSNGNPISLAIEPPLPGSGAGPSGVPVASIHITRRDGVVTLARRRGYITFAGRLASWNIGDLNGDGRSDYIVEEQNSEGTYIVPGTVRPGVHDPDDVGVRVAADKPNEAPFRQFRPVGDQNHDGADDIAVGDNLYEGRKLLAHRLGTTFTALPRPFRRVDNIVGTVRLNASGPPAIAQVQGGIADGPTDLVDHAEVRLLGKTVDCLLTATGPVPTIGPTITGQNLEVLGWNANGHRLIELRYSSRDGTTVYRWDFDA